MTETIRWDKDSDGIVVLTMDDPNQSANTMNRDYAASMAATVDRLEAEKDDITGVVITSAKKTFFAGGDLKDMIEAKPEDAKEGFEFISGIKAQLRRLETLGKPVVAAINGAALGGGLEIALACHHRIAADVKGSQIGLPEVSLGLLPGGGGVTRTVRLLGIQSALLNVLLQGQRHKPAKALELGLVARAGVHCGRAAAGGQGVDQGQPRGRAAVGRQGLQDPRRLAVAPGVRGEPAGVPGEPAQAAQGRQHAGAARDPVRRHRGRAGRHRHRARHRVPLPDRAAVRPGREEHDQGVLLRPAAHQLRRLAAGRLREVHRAEGGRARRRHDGRRHRLRVRPRRHGGRAQGRLPGGGREGQGLLGQAVRQGRVPRQGHPGEGRRDARADHADRRGRRPRRLRPGDRGRVREHRAEAQGVRARSRTSSRRTRCSAPTPRRCRSPVSPRA